MSVLVEALLRAQQDMSAVDLFSQWHDDNDDHSEPAQAKYYRHLVPAEAPGPGQQYAFEVSLDDCTGCKSCVTACHSLNGLDHGEVWRRVGVVHGGNAERSVQLSVTAACHHCLDPACLAGCPVVAYEKDPITGIVKHLDDQCIGCQYCVFTCPYDVPSFNASKGIVRKCDMCSARLAASEAPACVQSCPNEAIAIRTVDVQDVIDNSETGAALPGAPAPHHTYSTTSYKTDRVLPLNLIPADYHSVTPQHSHPALVAFLVLSQLAVGVFCVAAALGELAPSAGVLAAVVGAVALAASTLHLGRPAYAFRAVLGLRTSWLSREVLAFGAFASAAGGYVGAIALELDGYVGDAALAAAVTGGLGVACSVMVYAATSRPLWRGPITALKFGLTSAILGGATIGAVDAVTGGQVNATAYAVVAVATAAKLIVELSVLTHLGDRHNSPLKRTASLTVHTMRVHTRARLALGLVGGIALSMVLVSTTTLDGPLTVAAVGVAVASLAGELLERHLFFVTVSAPKMPGGLPA